MRLSVLLVAGCATLASLSPALAKDKVKPADAAATTGDQVACAGVYGPDSSEALLIETFGRENVVTGTLYGAEGIEYIGTTVYGDDPDRTMEFGWYDEESHEGLSFVSLSPSQTAPNGARVGMSVAEVQALNGAPFTLSGFWWDYGGSSNFETGKLSGQAEGGCYVSLRFGPREDYPEDLDVTAVSGDTIVPSDEPLLAELDVRVGELSLGYPDPNMAEDDAADD